jgi:hypothetical protein
VILQFWQTHALGLKALKVLVRVLVHIIEKCLSLGA